MLDFTATHHIRVGELRVQERIFLCLRQKNGRLLPGLLKWAAPGRRAKLIRQEVDLPNGGGAEGLLFGVIVSIPTNGFPRIGQVPKPLLRQDWPSQARAIPSFRQTRAGIQLTLFLPTPYTKC
jgi:hypothetical protein